MKILFLGDIFSKCGRDIVKRHLDSLKERYEIDLVVANGENSAHGKGMTKKIYEELMSYGIDAFTMGNHFLKNKDIVKWLDDVDNIARPLNIDGIVEGKIEEANSIALKMLKEDLSIALISKCKQKNKC